MNIKKIAMTALAGALLIGTAGCANNKKMTTIQMKLCQIQMQA